ncbi:hypothetical protein B1729_15755 [Microbacterium sp. B35-04]|uniref:hypothetical protein n=1 Tax=Microbacterium sp. B35-04 TaxID=1961716 RepID=UPI0013D31118|nr:hypothetical protein [Microbacterium sp. B35-04]KAF2412301.1 hypothetical protein B1729_15755 [Microbacterium sp. B35-04]
MPQRVFVDADVLAARTPYEWLALLRDETDAFQLHSSPAVVAEAVRLWRSGDPSARAAAAPRRLALLTASLDEVVGAAETDAEPGVGGRVGDSAVEDALTTGAHVLLSASARTREDGDALPFEICTPDEFLCLTDDTAPAAVRDVTRQRAAQPLADALAGAGCPAFAERVASHLRAIAR